MATRTGRTTRPRAVEAARPLAVRELTVLRRESVTRSMMRVTLGGPGIAGFTSDLPDEHVKLVFPDPDTGTTRPPVLDATGRLRWPSPFPPGREYTVRRFDADAGEAGELHLDVVVHDGGLASDWARQAETGSTIWVVGPRPSRVLPAEFGLHVLLGDDTALPAIARWLEELPAHARAVAAIEVTGPEDEQPLHVPDGSTLTWLHRGDAPAGTTRLLADFAEALDLPGDTHTFLFAAGEAGSLKPVREWARTHGLGPHQSTVSGYWRLGTARSHSTGLVGRVVHRLGHALDRLR